MFIYIYIHIYIYIYIYIYICLEYIQEGERHGAFRLFVLLWTIIITANIMIITIIR